MNLGSARTLLARLVGLLTVLGSVLCMLYLVSFGLGYGGSIIDLASGLYLSILLLSGLGTALDRRPARLALCLLLPLQACWLMTRIIYSTPRPGQACDMSCYSIPLDAVALPVALSFIAAWVVYPGTKPALKDS